MIAHRDRPAGPRSVVPFRRPGSRASAADTTATPGAEPIWSCGPAGDTGQADARNPLGFGEPVPQHPESVSGQPVGPAAVLAREGLDQARLFQLGQTSIER